MGSLLSKSPGAVNNFSDVVSLAVFLGAYSRNFLRARKKKYTEGYAHYTDWIYFQTLCLLPLLSRSQLARDIAISNTFGLGLGIHWFYAVTGYRLLIEFGDKKLENLSQWIPSLPSRLPLWVYLLGDAALHWTPFAVVSFILARMRFRKVGQRMWHKRIWVGVLTGFLHSTYCFFLSGSWNPKPLYDVDRTDIPLSDIKKAWLALFTTHVVGAASLLP